MEMPVPKRKKKNEPDAPRLNTRAKNQTTRPGFDAGVAPGTRRTPAQMEQVRVAEAAQQAAAAHKRQEAVDRVAAIEDQQNTHDRTYAETANHPVDPPRRAFTPALPADVDGARGERHPSDNEDIFIPSVSEEDEEEEDDVEEEVPRVGKPAKSTRNDVAAVRSTQDSSGTPAGSGQEGLRKRKVSENGSSNAKGQKKAKLGKKGGLATIPAAKKRLGGASSASGRSSLVANDDFDAPMTQYGGPAVDDDENEQLEHPVPAGKGKKKGLPMDTVLKITPVPTRRPTKKELRGNAKKWTLEHLPRGTASLFTSDVVPLARELLGSLEPFEKLTLSQMQGIVNRVFPQKEGTPGVLYKVTEDGPWYGLLQYRSNDWRSGFAIQANKGMKALLKTHQKSDSDDESDEEGEEQHADNDESNGGAPASEKPRPFGFDTPEGIAEFVEWALQTDEDSSTMAFQWAQWGDGKVKKGFFLSYLVVYAYAYHLSILDSIPPGYTRSAAHPFGALLTAVQAVERNLRYWKTGKWTVPSGTAGEFSGDNWGDIRTRLPGGITKLTRRATKFLSVLKTWDDARWEQLREAAAQWLETKKRRRGASSSRGTSEAEMEEIIEEDPEVVVVSD
ncbi:hypothetical protein B0H10DRAFT_2226306 [Mycena sp. CBHHK59/15]|nr:hypothetical protein B0H10DRAFT_2226306 [Mycena sp. CBHHK59/15]